MTGKVMTLNIAVGLLCWVIPSVYGDCVVGRVIDNKTEKPIVGATVAIDEFRVAKTDDDGIYTFQIPQAKKPFSVKVTHRDYPNPQRSDDSTLKDGLWRVPIVRMQATDDVTSLQHPLRGLIGILPLDIPTAINEEAFAVLDGNWQEWAEKTAAEVAKLYLEEGLDVAGQRQQLEILKRKLATMETSLKDARYRSIHNSLGSLHAALKRRVIVAEAILDTLTIDPQKAVSERLEDARQELAKSLKDLETELQAVKNGSAWL